MAHPINQGTPMPATKKNIDWEAIEAAYRAGAKSVNAIAKEQGVAEGTIRKRAKKEGWQRDLTRSVRSAVKSKLVRTDSTSTKSGSVRTDSEIVDSAADEIVGVVQGHRTAIGQWKGIANKLAVALSSIEVDESNHGEFARSLNSGVDALGKVIKLERQAFNLDEEDPGTAGKTLDELLAKVSD